MSKSFTALVARWVTLLNLSGEAPLCEYTTVIALGPRHGVDPGALGRWARHGHGPATRGWKVHLCLDGCHGRSVGKVEFHFTPTKKQRMPHMHNRFNRLQHGCSTVAAWERKWNMVAAFGSDLFATGPNNSAFRWVPEDWSGSASWRFPWEFLVQASRICWNRRRKPLHPLPPGSQARMGWNWDDLADRWLVTLGPAVEPQWMTFSEELGWTCWTCWTY